MQSGEILVVDDEARIRKLLALNLKSLGYHVSTAVDGIAAIKAINELSFDLILLDLMMPKMDGFAVLEHIRHSSTVPVIILTAKEGVADKVRGFELGADDYVAKPFALEELFARVKAVLRRAKPDDVSMPGQMAVLENGPLHIHLLERRVMCFGQEVRLSVNEFKLLTYMMRHLDTVMVHEQLLAHVWGGDHEWELAYLRVTLTRLRNKLREKGLEGDCGIISYSGIGYKMESLATSTDGGH